MQGFSLMKEETPCRHQREKREEKKDIAFHEGELFWDRGDNSIGGVGTFGEEENGPNNKPGRKGGLLILWKELPRKKKGNQLKSD